VQRAGLLELLPAERFVRLGDANPFLRRLRLDQKATFSKRPGVSQGNIDENVNRQLPLSIVRAQGIAVTTVNGTVYPGRQIAGTANAGFYTSPIRVPDALDVSRPASLEFYTLLADTQAGNVVYGLTYNQWLPGAAAPTATLISLTITQPPLSNVNLTALAFPFPAKALKPGHVLGLLLQRLGLDGNDTYPGGAILLEAATLIYRPRCAQVCCP
jgi:hypothetical protein